VTQPLAWAAARRILAIRLDAAGDVLMTTPALRALREAASNRHITLLTSPSGAAAARLVPEVDEVIEYVAPWMKPASSVETDEHLAMIERLRAERFDAAVIFTVYSQNPLPSAMLAHLAGIPLRLAHCRENPYGLLTDWAPESEPEREARHEVRRQLDLVATVGAHPSSERMSVEVPPEASARVRRILGDAIDFERPWAVMHVGASASSRRYPHFAEVARALSEVHGWQLVFTGGAEEADLVQEVREASGVPSLSLVGALDLGELAALIAQAPVLMSNNTGPAHLAAAVGTPVVDLYALTNPQHAPWRVPHRLLFHEVPCAPCYRSICPEGHHACLDLVPPGEVVAAALDLVAQSGGHGVGRAEGVTGRPALLLDSDGVLFDTEGRHLAACLQALDALRPTLEVPSEATIADAYARHARGRDRYEGMRALLEALGLSLEPGDAGDAAGATSVSALANLKNEIYAATLEREDVPPMRGARDLMHAARDRGFAIAVVSSSRHARHLLAESGLDELADVIVAAPMDRPMQRKPHPDPYLWAIEALRVKAEDCVAVEDAVSGVQSARAAGVGRVVGLASVGGESALTSAGAHGVVDGLGRLALLSRPLHA